MSRAWAWWHIIFAAVAGMAWLYASGSLPGCGRSTPGDDPAAPARLVERLRDLHQQHSYKEMESLIEPGRVGLVVDTLMAVDRLLGAAERLQQTAEQRLGPTAAVVCNLSHLADYLGPFSRNVQIVSTRLEGEKAWVTFQVGERVPVERVEIRRLAGQWRYMPDEADTELPGLLGQLAEKMGRLRDQAESDTYSEQGFLEEYMAKVLGPLQAHLEKVTRQRQEKAKAAASGPAVVD